MQPQFSPLRSQPSSKAEDLYVDYLARVDNGERVDFEAWCAEHPKHAADLQQIRSEDQRLMNLAKELGFAAASLVEGPAESSKGGPQPQAPSPANTCESTRFVENIAEREETFGKYHLRRLIGRGSMGEVYKVWDEDLRRHLAMKILSGSSREMQSADLRTSRALARFVEEAQVTSQLDHPGIVPIHDIGVSPHDKIYFTMKLVKGRELASVFEMVQRSQNGWTLTRALGLILKTTEAMAYAHSKGVLHRDLKPANIMVGRYGAVYVMDWGLARVMMHTREKALLSDGHSTLVVNSNRSDRVSEDPDNPIATRQGDSVGTPVYMAPEQARGDNAEVGPWTDIYGVGAMLYHLISGRAPYTEPGKRIGAHAVLHRVKHGPPVPTEELAPLVPSELHAIVAKAMARDPNDRYSTMEDLQEDILAFIEGRVVRAAQSGRRTGAWKWLRRNPALAAAAAAGVVVLGASAWALSSRPVQAAQPGEVVRTDDAAGQILENPDLDPELALVLRTAREELRSTNKEVSAAALLRIKKVLATM